MKSEGKTKPKSVSDTLTDGVTQLFNAMVRAKFDPSVAYALKSAQPVEKARMLEAADACREMAVITEADFREVSEAAHHVYFVLSDRAGVHQKSCQMCDFGLHIHGLHTITAQLNKPGDLGTEPLCDCYCQRRNGGK